MLALPDSPKTIRKSHFSFREPTLLFARVRLHPEALDLRGWHLRGLYRRQIPLGEILQVDVTSNGRLLLWLTSGEPVRLHLDDAMGWKEAIEHYLTRRRQTTP